LQAPSSSTSSSGVAGNGKSSTGVCSSTAAAAGRTRSSLARSSSNIASDERQHPPPGIVRIEIRDAAPRPSAKDQQLLKPLAQTQSASAGPAAASKLPYKPPTKK